MNWKSIRLELARTEDFPQGSASRAYLLHLPLDDEGLVDEPTLKGSPARATVHRFWPNERDMAGYVIPTPHGWALSYRPGEDDDVLQLLDEEVADQHVLVPDHPQRLAQGETGHDQRALERAGRGRGRSRKARRPDGAWRRRAHAGPARRGPS